MAEDLGAEAIRVQGSDVAKALMRVADDKNVGGIIIGHSRHGRLHEILRGSIVQRLLRLAVDIDVHVVAYPLVFGCWGPWNIDDLRLRQLVGDLDTDLVTFGRG